MDDQDRRDQPDLGEWRREAARRVSASVVHETGGARPAEHRATPYVVLFVTASIGLAVATLLTVASAEIYDNVTDHNGIAGFDRPVLDQMIAWRTADRNSWVTHATSLGSASTMPIIATVAALAIAWWWRRWTPVLLMAIAAGGSLVMTVLGKEVVNRARPDHALAVPPFESSASFPSGHSLNTWVILGIVAYLVACRLGNTFAATVTVVVALVLAVAMGLSRVYLGLHWLTDVLVAWTLGTAWLAVIITGHRLALTVADRTRHTAPHALAPQ
ncbi:MAG: phosphatase PAP2 family protein [Propionibacteriales bacterium]|nr:phosphatase PAP2 family protein [Propionibacteriales bacterium]